MYPYSLDIPRNHHKILPELEMLILEHECPHQPIRKNGSTSISLYFNSIDQRNDFIADLNAKFPMFAGCGTRLVAIPDKRITMYLYR